MTNPAPEPPLASPSSASSGSATAAATPGTSLPLRARQSAFVGRVTAAISSDRLSPFYSSATQPRWEAVATYAWNVALCEAFYPLLHHVEVVFRNAMDSAIAPAYPPQAPAHVHSWLDAPSSPLTPYARDDVLRAKKKLIPWDQKKAIFGMSKRPVRHGDLLASLDFGFWTGLLHKNYFFQSNKDPRLWPQLLPAVFPHAREAWDAKFLGKASRDLNEVRKFRNRIFHHEPIWRRTLANDRLLILELISWSSPEMAALAASTDRVSEVLSDAFRRRLRIRVYRESRR